MLSKSQLLEQLNHLNRGINIHGEQQRALLELITQVENCNPTPSPALASHLLDGDWELRYTTSSELLGIDGVPLLKLGPVYQCIRINTAQVYNLAEVNGLAGLNGLVCVSAGFSLAPSCESEELDTETAEGRNEGDRRLIVEFNRGIFGLQRWLDYQGPQQFISKVQSDKRFVAIDFTIQGRQGWIDLTYLDQDLRINRGNEGSIFVLTRA